MTAVFRRLCRKSLPIIGLAFGLSLLWSPAIAQGLPVVPDPCAGGCGPVGGGGGGGIGGGGGGGDFGGGAESSVDSPEAGVDFSPELFSDTLKSLGELSPRPVPNRGNGSQERRLKDMLKRLRQLGNLMPNRGDPGGAWDPASAGRWNPNFAIEWHIEPVLFTIPPGLNQAWARFNRDKEGRGVERLGLFPQRDAATLALTNAAFDDMQAGDFAGAVEKFEEALRRNPAMRASRRLWRKRATAPGTRAITKPSLGLPTAVRPALFISRHR